MMTKQDKQQLEEKGISEEQLEEELRYFAEGFPYLKLYAAASAGQGIMTPSDEEADTYRKAWDAYLHDGAAGPGAHRVVKFVPASGAASRMFKNLFAFVSGDAVHPDTDFVKTFISHIKQFAFYEALDAACQRLYGKDIAALVAGGGEKKVVSALLTPEGLDYGQLPKGLLAFHRYPDGPRTPVEEHLAEGALYACGADGCAHIHFTVSGEHRKLFSTLVDEKIPALRSRYGANYEVTYSEQKPSTDTVAVTPDNELFRLQDGRMLFRPGGHGALIHNLNDLDADIVFIKNIDNVVPDSRKGDTVSEKKMLAGLLVTLQQQIFDYLRLLDSGIYSIDDLLLIQQFVRKRLFCRNPEAKCLEDTELAVYLRGKLNRPIRVCAMVRNEGEPGGGPFLVYSADGSVQLQILESSQIDMGSQEAKAMFVGGTHFNPVDLVCGLRDYQGRKFDLLKYVDPLAGFISHKSKDGRELKALERPGLWNGSMSDWNTVFVEVSSATFNPVKTVNDLLRPQHQS